MGRMKDLEIANRQKAAGIEEATDGRARILLALSGACFEAIKIIELEKSGIRDGDGCWHGSDVIGLMCSNLTELSAKLMDTYRPPETAEPQWDDPAFKPISDALVQRLIALGEDESAVIGRAKNMMMGWMRFSDNSMDEYGHETCRDWMDEEVVRLLDESLRVRYGLEPQTV